MREREIGTLSGWIMLVVMIMLVVVMGYQVYWLITAGAPEQTGSIYWWMLTGACSLFVVWLVLLAGFFIVEPNSSKVLLLFGKYVGTVKRSGFHYVNPFMTKRSVSLRFRTLNGEKLKVNDLDGNPVEIATVVVWRVRDTFQACFEVDNYEEYVFMQSETALRHLASSYPYDADGEVVSLRHNADEIAVKLKQELQERLSRAGVEVSEARLSHLAYAQEIAGVMLRRQQAAAVIAARQKIVEGAVSMVEMALKRLEQDNTVVLDEERKAVMVSNLMVVLCGEQSAQPVINTGTLYT